jgi:hypothetical protein
MVSPPSVDLGISRDRGGELHEATHFTLFKAAT